MMFLLFMGFFLRQGLAPSLSAWQICILGGKSPSYGIFVWDQELQRNEKKKKKAKKMSRKMFVDDLP
jgi:hypothetical protein